MKEYNKQVSIIIVNYNTKELTKNAIQSVFDKTENIDYEIIVIDNASQDGSVEDLKNTFQEKIKIIESKENLGFGRANNLGIKQAQGKYVFLLNSDTELINNAIKIFYDYMEQNENVGVCGGNLYNKNNEPTTSYCMYRNTITSYLYWRFIQICSKFFAIFNGKKFYCNFNYSNKVKEVGYITGADMFIRKSVLEKSGLFDESIFMYSEDIDLNFRIREQGYKIKSIPQAKIYHIENASFKVDTDENILRNYRIRKYSDYKFYFQTFGKLTYFIYLETQISNIIRIVINTLLPKFILKKIYLVVKPTNVYKQMYKIDKEEYIISKKKCKKNIVAFTCYGVGDFIWATSAISLIKQYNKNVTLTLIAFDSYKVLIDNKLGIDKVLFTKYKYFFSKNKFIRWIYKFYWLITLTFHIHNFDMLLCLDIFSPFTKFAKKIYKIKEIVGADTLKYGYNTKNYDANFYTKQVKMKKDGDRNHCMMRYQDIIRAMFPTYNLSMPILPNTDYLKQQIKEKFLQKTKKYIIALCTTGTNVIRTIPVEYTCKLLEKLENFNNITIFITGNTKKQKEEADFLIKKFKNIDIKNICGKTSLLELKELLKNMNLLISVDTGVVHLAAVSNIPIISFYSIARSEHSGPVSYNSIPIYQELKCFPCFYDAEINKNVCYNPKCITDISVDTVINKIKEILNYE